MAKIKVKIVVIENVVEFYVLEQDERSIRSNRSKREIEIRMPYGMWDGALPKHVSMLRVSSRSHPVIQGKVFKKYIHYTVFLRGSMPERNEWFGRRVMVNNREAINLKNSIILALEYWAKNLPEFVNSNKEDTIKDIVRCKERDNDKILNGNIYTF